MCVLVDIEHVSVKINAVQTLFCVYSRRDCFNWKRWWCFMYIAIIYTFGWNQWVCGHNINCLKFHWRKILYRYSMEHSGIFWSYSGWCTIIIWKQYAKLMLILCSRISRTIRQIWWHLIILILRSVSFLKYNQELKNLPSCQPHTHQEKVHTQSTWALSIRINLLESKRKIRKKWNCLTKCTHTWKNERQ